MLKHIVPAALLVFAPCPASIAQEAAEAVPSSACCDLFPDAAEPVSAASPDLDVDLEHVLRAYGSSLGVPVVTGPRSAEVLLAPVDMAREVPPSEVQAFVEGLLAERGFALMPYRSGGASVVEVLDARRARLLGSFVFAPSSSIAHLAQHPAVPFVTVIPVADPKAREVPAGKEGELPEEILLADARCVVLVGTGLRVIELARAWGVVPGSEPADVRFRGDPVSPTSDPADAIRVPIRGTVEDFVRDYAETRHVNVTYSPNTHSRIREELMRFLGDEVEAKDASRFFELALDLHGVRVSEIGPASLSVLQLWLDGPPGQVSNRPFALDVEHEDLGRYRGSSSGLITVLVPEMDVAAIDALLMPLSRSLQLESHPYEGKLVLEGKGRNVVLHARVLAAIERCAAR